MNIYIYTWHFSKSSSSSSTNNVNRIVCSEHYHLSSLQTDATWSRSLHNQPLIGFHPKAHTNCRCRLLIPVRVFVALSNLLQFFTLFPAKYAGSSLYSATSIWKTSNSVHN